MRRPIEKAVVLGAGTMGARIAAHLANAGIPVYLLDIAPRELNAEEKRKGLALDHPAVRNRIVLAGLEAAKKSKPAAFFAPEAARLVTPGNLEDNIAWCGEADWIIEAVAENLEIKRKLFERVETVRKPGTLVTTNTSGLPIHMIAEGRSEDFQKHFAGTHFFNPPRYMKLVELIPGPKTLPEVVSALDEICDVTLGKGVVVAKDTPNFIANRIGTFSILKAFSEMQALDMTIEEVDACTGPAIGWPNSATFRTADIVGLDVLAHVVKNLYESIPDDESREMYRVPPLLEALIAKGWLGEKAGSGFYQRVKKGGDSEILTLDWKKMEYRPREKGKLGLDRSGESDRRYARADSHAHRARARRQRRRQSEPLPLELSQRDVPVRRAPHSGNRQQRRRRGPRHALGIRMGIWPVRGVGRNRRRAHGQGDRARRQAVAAARDESSRVAGEILLPDGKRPHELFRFRLGGAQAARRAARNHYPEIAERAHGGRAGKFRREPDRSRRRRPLLRIPRQDECDRRRHLRHADGGCRAPRNRIRGHGDRQSGAEFFRRRKSDAPADDRAGGRVGRYSPRRPPIPAREYGAEICAATGRVRAAGTRARRRLRNQSARRADSRRCGGVYRPRRGGRRPDSGRRRHERKCSSARTSTRRAATISI